MKKLKHISTLPADEFNKKFCKDQLSKLKKRLFELQNVFYADGRYGLLIVLQGMDTSGKDGVVRHVMTCMNPNGLRVQSFKKPTAEEEKYDFFYRIYPHIPARSMIQVFNRSYYEDVIVPSINNTFTKDAFKHRCSLINELEQHLILNNIHVLKFFLHISKEEQEEKIKERLTIPHKRWKYCKDDKQAAKQFDTISGIYDNVIGQCSQVPWHIIPSDKRWYRNYLVAKTIAEHLEKLDLKYPDLQKK